MKISRRDLFACAALAPPAPPQPPNFVFIMTGQHTGHTTIRGHKAMVKQSVVRWRNLGVEI